MDSIYWMPDARYRMPDQCIARAAQALAPRVALSFYIRAKILVCSLNSEYLVCLKRNEILIFAIIIRVMSLYKRSYYLFHNHQYYQFENNLKSRFLRKDKRLESRND